MTNTAEHITTPLPYGVRAVLRAKSVAGILDANLSTVYRLVKDGQLEGHRVGSDIRIYADSLARYQESTTIQAANARKQAPKPQKRTHTSAHNDALALLHSLGVPSRVAI